jgi:2-iminobutanoate/2-iminopropanoate deaminase
MNGETQMFSDLFTRRAFAGRFATIVSGLGLAASASSTSAAAEPKKETTGGVKKMDFDGKPAGTGFITPVITFGGVIYVAGQGAHSHDQSEFPMDIDTHTKKVMENVKHLVEIAGGSMDSILQLTVFLTKIEDYDGMNKVFKTYFPNGGPARTTVAVAALPGNSLVEINCTAAIVKK